VTEVTEYDVSSDEEEESDDEGDEEEGFESVLHDEGEGDEEEAGEEGGDEEGSGIIPEELGEDRGAHEWWRIGIDCHGEGADDEGDSETDSKEEWPLVNTETILQVLTVIAASCPQGTQ